MKKCISLFAVILIIAIFGITGSNNVSGNLAGDPPVGTTPLPKVNGINSEQIFIKSELNQFRFQQEYMI